MNFIKANYRPLTILPVLNNVFERLIALQMEEFYNEILSDYTYAYRKQFGCETALLKLVDWKCSCDNKELVAVVSIDLSKAFDTISHDPLLAKLKAYGMTEECCNFFQSYLRNRMQCVKVGDTLFSWLKEEFHKAVFWDQCSIIFFPIICFKVYLLVSFIHMLMISKYLTHIRNLRNLIN